MSNILQIKQDELNKLKKDIMKTNHNISTLASLGKASSKINQEILRSQRQMLESITDLNDRLVKLEDIFSKKGEMKA